MIEVVNVEILETTPMQGCGEGFQRRDGMSLVVVALCTAILSSLVMLNVIAFSEG